MNIGYAPGCMAIISNWAYILFLFTAIGCIYIKTSSCFSSIHKDVESVCGWSIIFTIIKQLLLYGGNELKRDTGGKKRLDAVSKHALK